MQTAVVGVVAVGLVVVGVQGAPAFAAQSASVSAAKKLSIDGPATGRVGRPVKVTIYLPSKPGTVTWGDGTTGPAQSGLMTLCMGSVPACAEAARKVAMSHAYAVAGTYTVTVVSPRSTPTRASMTIRIK